MIVGGAGVSGHGVEDLALAGGEVGEQDLLLHIGGVEVRRCAGRGALMMAAMRCVLGSRDCSATVSAVAWSCFFWSAFSASICSGVSLLVCSSFFSVLASVLALRLRRCARLGSVGMGCLPSATAADLLVGKFESVCSGVHGEGGIVVEALVEDSSLMDSGLSCCSNQFRDRPRTASMSPGRGPKVKRLSS